jgi:antitoxin VapB
MALNIVDPEIDRMVAELAEVTGEPVSEAVKKALEERLQREKRRNVPDEHFVEDLTRIAKRCAARTGLDRRHPDEIIGYDEHGLPS